MTVAQTIWNFLKNKGLTDYAVAGIMGNLQAESGLRSNNLEDTRNNTLGSDDYYTKAVDNGSYKNFIDDGAGYGIAQWTDAPRKRKLWNITQANNKSISDLGCQLTLLYEEMKERNLVDSMNKSTNVEGASTIFLKKFEIPANSGLSVQKARAAMGQEFYNQFKGTQGGSNMKYEGSNAPLVCMMTNSTCYKQTSKMEIKGVLWHSTGANNPNLKRYVQPAKNDANYTVLMQKLGKNTGGNDWNSVEVQAGLNAWIGKLADGNVTSVQTMPWNYRPWGCGSGSRGSCNNGWIQFEICEDALTDKNYFEKVYNEACELTAYLCKKYNLNPKGSVNFNGIQVPVILCHQDSAQLGLGSNHADVYHWFTKYGKTMNNVRADVAAILSGASSESAIIEDEIKPVIYDGILRKGSEGAAVKQLQENLVKLGYDIGKWGADGDFGNATLEAVMKFQKDHGLDDDGEVGPLTLAAIQSALNQASTPQLYRVREAWNKPTTQKGAFTNKDKAIALVKALGSKYKVYNNVGKVVYPEGASDEQPASNNNSNYNIQPAKTYSDVVIGSSSKDENGQYRGGRAGDQTGKEVWTLNWYNQNWTNVYRPTEALLAEKIAVACEKACANNNIGYDQLTRNGILREAKYANLDMAKINAPCNCDCSSLVSACCVCAGLSESVFFPGGNGCVTSTIGDACLKTGKFKNLTESKYLTQKDYLRRGDILCNRNQHVVIVLGNGKYAEKFETSNTNTNPSNAAPAAAEVGGVPFLVRVTANRLNIRENPNANAKIVSQIMQNGVYTIVKIEGGYGKLKSGIGWIDLSYVTRL